MKTDLFQSCGHCWVFQICSHIEYSPFTASSLRIWNSLTGIPSPPLALFVVMLSKAHLISHSRMSGSRWVIIPSWLLWWRHGEGQMLSREKCRMKQHSKLVKGDSVGKNTSFPFLRFPFLWRERNHCNIPGHFTSPFKVGGVTYFGKLWKKKLGVLCSAQFLPFAFGLQPWPQRTVFLMSPGPESYLLRIPALLGALT